MRLRIDLAYDGSDFHGWARQLELRTVQGELEQAIDTVLRTTGSALTVAGRTDAGVHARGQVAHVDLADDLVTAAAGRSHEPTLDAVRRRLNGVLGHDVRIQRVTEAPAGFDAGSPRSGDATPTGSPTSRSSWTRWRAATCSPGRTRSTSTR